MTPARECVSFPKSGRTWLRYMLNVIGHDASVHFHHDGFEFNDGGRPPHDFNLTRHLSRYSADAKVIYLDRDPRDVMVSLYHQVTGRFRDFFDYRGSLSDFIRDDYFGAGVLAHFRTLWSSLLANRPYLHVRYEDLHHDPAAVLSSVLRYYGLPVEDEQIARAVEAGRLPNMRQLEQSGTFAEPWLRPRNGFAKVRRGQTGAFRDELSGPDIEYLNTVFGSATPWGNHTAVLVQREPDPLAPAQAGEPRSGEPRSDDPPE